MNSGSRNFEDLKKESCNYSNVSYLGKEGSLISSLYCDTF